MSLSTRGLSAPKKPGVHYFSPIFEPAAHEAARQAMQPRAAHPARITAANQFKKPGNEGSRRAESGIDRVLRRANEPEEVRVFCTHFNLSLKAGRVLFQLWKARGAVVPAARVALTMRTYTKLVWLARRGHPEISTLCETGIGYSLMPASVAKLDGLIARSIGKAGADE